MQNEDIPVFATKPPAIAIFTLIDLALLSWRRNNKTQNMHNPFLTAGRRLHFLTGKHTSSGTGARSRES